MGVPKFYRWISERYPKINQIVSDHALLPEFDHLYLDMNGIIHGCTHPHDRDVSDGLSERDMMLGIMQYLERIVTIVKPKVSLYMAIDGVAPRAKLNQQRSRRFRSAKDLAETTQDLDAATKQNVFDSNCITPGTEFLAKVSKVIQYFIRKKIKEDSLWKHLKVIFSGHDIPGEGEHKIMNYIRQMRNQPNYQPNTRHCMYGQDADLIMLGLVTHEPHFTLLREVVDFNMNRNNNNKNSLKAVKKFTKQSDFQLLHLSVLREYLSFEFVEQQPELYDLERCIDDFVFLTFTLGCDFLPHGVLDIGENAFDLLFGLYKDQRRSWGHGQYLTFAGEICDALRLEHLLTAIGACENEILENREESEKEYTKKKRRWDKRDGRAPGPSDQEIQMAETEKEQDYASMMSSVLAGNNNPDDFIEGWVVATSNGEKDYKGRYYHEKLHFKPTDKEKHWALCKSYIEGLQWCLAYYYRGCISWGWFYPYHYSPMMSDLKHLPRMFSEIKFELGAPLTPFQQLMACLPPASATLVPKLYRGLMTSSQSPIIHFYPTDFEIDANGKRNPWESLNLLPFIEIDLLKATIAQQCPPEKLAPGEEERNKIGRVMLYRHDPTCMETAPSPNRDIGLPDLVKCCSSVHYFDEDLGLSPNIFEPRLIPDTQIPYPGYPSLGVLPMQSVVVEPIGLNCFGNPSKYATMMLTMFEMPQLPPMEELAASVLDRSVYVNWPMMHEAKIAAVSDGCQEFRMVKGKPKAKQLNNSASSKWVSETEIMSQMYCRGSGMPGSGGVQIGEIKVRLKVLPLQGMKTNPVNGSKKKCYGGEEADVPLQLCLWQAPAPDPRLIECGPKTLKDRFPIDSRVVLTKGKHRGCVGKVVSIVDTKSVGIHVQTMPPENQFGLAIARSVQEYYVSSVDAARILKLHPSVIGKIMGRMQFVQGNYDLGLNLKTSDGNCVVGYTRKRVDESERKARGGKKAAWDAGDSVLVVGSRLDVIDDDDDDARLQWEYSPKAIRAVQEYQQKFPALFSGLKKAPNERKYDAKVVMGPKGEDLLPVIREWLDKHESARIPRSPVSSELLPAEATQAIEKAAAVRLLATKKKGFPKEAMLKVPGSALYLEASTGATDVLLASDLNENSYPVLGDRVVNLCSDGVPFGARGTVVGIHEAATTGSVEVVMDEEFVGGTTLQGHCSNFHGKLCLWSQVLKIAVGGDPAERSVASKTVSQKAVTKLLKNTNNQSPTEPQTASATPPRPKSASRSQHTTPSRANSAGRGRQGAWREARGPPEKGNGFKRPKKAVSGLERWKQQRDVVSASNDLKARLGISDPLPQLPQEDPATNQLKAMLGVTPNKKGAGPQRKGKKEGKNVAATPEPVTILQRVKPTPSVPESTQNPPSAATTPADKLLHLLATKKSSIQAAPVPLSSPFNFTYTEVGQAPPPVVPVPTMPQFVPAPPPHPNPVTWSSSEQEYPPLDGKVALTAEPKKASPALLVPSAVASSRTTSLPK